MFTEGFLKTAGPAEIKAAVAASKAARGASKFTSSVPKAGVIERAKNVFKSAPKPKPNLSTGSLKRIEAMPNKNQARIERNYSKSVKPKPVVRPTAAAPAPAPKPAAKPADKKPGSFMGITKRDAAIGAGGAAAGYLAAHSGDNGQRQ
jgi:hypothetical protein